MSLFQKPEVLVQRNTVVFPEFDYLQRNLMLNCKALKEHIATRAIYIPNDNLLSQILYGAPQMEEGESDGVFFSRVAATSIGRYTALNIVSEGGYGMSVEGGVYSDINEYYLAVESEYDNKHTDLGVRIISHPYVGMGVPEFTVVTTVERLSRPKEQFAYFTIDFAKLILAYARYERAERKKLKEGEELSNPINHFLTSQVYPSLVEQHVDLVFFNKLTRLITGEAFINARTFTDLSLADYSRKVDDIISDYTDHIMSQMTSLDQLLMLELPSGRMLWDLLLEEDSKIQQTHWFYFLANSRMYLYIALALAITDVGTDADEVHGLKYMVKDLANHRTVLSHMTKEAKAEYGETIRLLSSYLKDV